MAIHSNQNGTVVDMYKIYTLARQIAKERCIKIPKGAWGTLARKAHPLYTVSYYDGEGIAVASVAFKYEEECCDTKCNTGCNSIW